MHKGLNYNQIADTTMDQHEILDACLLQQSTDGVPVRNNTISFKEETGAESARIKQMVNDFKKDVAFYQKMSEVYRLAEVAFK